MINERKERRERVRERGRKGRREGGGEGKKGKLMVKKIKKPIFFSEWTSYDNFLGQCSFHYPYTLRILKDGTREAKLTREQ